MYSIDKIKNMLAIKKVLCHKSLYKNITLIFSLVVYAALLKVYLLLLIFFITCKHFFWEVWLVINRRESAYLCAPSPSSRPASRPPSSFWCPRSRGQWQLVHAMIHIGCSCWSDCFSRLPLLQTPQAESRQDRQSCSGFGPECQSRIRSGYGNGLVPCR